MSYANRDIVTLRTAAQGVDAHTRVSRIEARLRRLSDDDLVNPLNINEVKVEGLSARLFVLGDQLTLFILDILVSLGRGAIASLPVILTVVIILFLTNALHHLIKNVMRSVDLGKAVIPGMHRDTLPATRRITGVRTQPEPFVAQRALADFYVEYELFAYIDKPLERILIMSALHGAIQDAFNEAGLQIMSPHFAFQPKQDVVVPREKWFEPPAKP